MLSPSLFWAIILWPLSISLLFTPAAPFVIITAFGAVITTIVWLMGLPSSQSDRDQLDGVLDLFAFYTKWEKDGNTYTFMKSISVRPNRDDGYDVTIYKTNTTIATNRYYTRKFAAKIAALHDANELNVLVNLTKEAASA